MCVKAVLWVAFVMHVCWCCMKQLQMIIIILHFGSPNKFIGYLVSVCVLMRESVSEKKNTFVIQSLVFHCCLVYPLFFSPNYKWRRRRRRYLPIAYGVNIYYNFRFSAYHILYIIPWLIIALNAVFICHFQYSFVCFVVFIFIFFFFSFFSLNIECNSLSLFHTHFSTIFISFK